MILPENKPKERDITPKIYLIWGESMSGKTYIARTFPNPILLNTDGNAKKVDTPSIEIKSWEMMVGALKELQTNNTFETVIIDLIDDIKTMIEDYILKEYNQKQKKDLKSYTDIPYGGGYAQVKNIYKNFMMSLSSLNKNIIFISHIKTISEITPMGTSNIEQPSLEERYLNMTMGRCDLVIQAKKRGSVYTYTVKDKRDKYTKEDIKDKRILNILEQFKNIFEENNKLEIKKIGDK